MPLNLFYTMVQKSQKWPKTQIKGGGSCLNCVIPGCKLIDFVEVEHYSTVGCRRTARLEFHLKIRTTPGCKNSLTTPKQRLLWRRLFRRHCWLQNDSSSAVWNISAAFPARHASSPTVCTLQTNQRASKTDWKLRTRLAGVVKIRTIWAGTVYPTFIGTQQYCMDDSIVFTVLTPVFKNVGFQPPDMKYHCGEAAPSPRTPGLERKLKQPRKIADFLFV